MRNLIVTMIAFVILVGGFIVYMEIDKRKFIDSLSPPSPVVDLAVNRAAPTRASTQENKEPKLYEMDPDEFVSKLRRQLPEEFGYSEAVETYVKLTEKRLNESLTIDEKVAFLEAAFYLYPSEANRKSLIYTKWIQSKGPNFHPRDDFSDEDIAELRELGIPVIHRGNVMIINPPSDRILKHINENLGGKYSHIFDGYLESPQSMPVPDTVSSEDIGEDTASPPARSEILPVPPETQVLGPPGHVHHEDGHVHETQTVQTPPTPTGESIEARGWEGLSLEQREQAKQLMDQYGSEEGFRRLQESDPEAARQFELVRRPAQDTPSGDTPPDEAP